MLGWAKYDRSGREGFRRYKLTHDEWNMLEQLDPLLAVRCQASAIIS